MKHRIKTFALLVLTALAFLLGVANPTLVSAHVNPSVTHKDYRWRNDDGSESTATWKAVLNTSITGVSTTEIIRVRFSLQETASASIAIASRLEFSTDATGCTDGTWTAADTSTTAWRVTDSANITNDAATTQQISSGSFQAGSILDTSNPDPTTISISGQTTEVEFAIRGDGAAASTTYRFRLTNNGTLLDTYTNCAVLTTAAPTALAISASAGSKAANVDSGATNAFVHDTACTTDATCAAFKMTTDAGGTATVTSIKITETGTVTANTELTNPTIIYDTDANYSNGTGGTFGTLASFAADQTATITGSLAIPPSSTRYFYVRVDMLNGTARPDGGLTVNYQIAAATDVVSDATESGSGTLAGTTTVRPNVTSFSNSTEPALTDGARTGQTISIAGHGFGTTCNGTTAKAEIGTYILSCTGATFTDTTITIAVDSGVNVYGGTGASGLLVTIGSTADDARSTFYVYPDVTSLSPTAATGAKEGDVVTITGTKFRALQGTGSVSFNNCGTTAGTIGGWGDTSITVTVPTGVLDNDDACDIVVTRDTDAKTVTSTGYTILPEVTSLSVCTACNSNAGREYAAGDTDGVVMISGKHFGTAQGVNGKVEFTGGFGTVLATIHGTAEGACTTSGWAAAGTSVCVEVPAGISDSVYTGTVTATRNDLKTNVWTTFRVLPRIITNTPATDVIGNVIQIDGNHFCQSGTCPPTPPTAGDVAEFGTTDAISTDFVTTPNCTGASKWSHTQVCVKVPVGTPNGSQPTKITSNTSYVSNALAFTVPSTLPASGTLTSVVFDTGVTDGAAYNSISWKGTLVGSSQVRFQLATAVASTGPWTFIGGATCASGDWYNATNSDKVVETNCPGHNNKRYYRYKIRLCSASDCATPGGDNPIVTDVNVSWSP